MKTCSVFLIVILLVLPAIPLQAEDQEKTLFIPNPVSHTGSNQKTLSYQNGSCIIIRDDYGVPHVYADTHEEIAFGVGYAIAEDRLWQADVFRREATGRLSEIGIGNASNDHWTRIYGYTTEENTELFSTIQSPYKLSLIHISEPTRPY